MFFASQEVGADDDLAVPGTGGMENAVGKRQTDQNKKRPRRGPVLDGPDGARKSGLKITLNAADIGEHACDEPRRRDRRRSFFCPGPAAKDAHRVLRVDRRRCLESGHRQDEKSRER